MGSVLRALLPGVVAAACGARTELDLPDGATAGGNLPPTSCEAFAQTVCDRALQCAPTVVRVGLGHGRSFGDRETCLVRVALACREWLRASDTTLTPEGVRACGAVYARGACADVATRFLDDRLGCAAVAGVRADGAGCSSDAQCRSGQCRPRLDGACARCVARPVIASSVGDACGRGRPCGLPQQCIAGRCAWGPVEGEACGECVPYLASRCVDGRCLAAPVRAEGESCGNTLGASTPRPAGCAPGSDCVNRNDFGAGQCRALRREGEACDVYGDRTCLFPSRCVRGRCTLPSTDCR